MTFESEGLLIVVIYIWLPPVSYVVFSDNSGFPIYHSKFPKIVQYEKSGLSLCY